MKLRRKVASTAIVYFYRVFKSKIRSASEYYLLACTCLFLASKVEESAVNLQLFLSEIIKIREDLSLDVSSITDAEFLLLQDLQFSLIVFHPYSLLSRYLTEIGHANYLSVAWNALNDLYKSSVILQYSPHSLALGIIFFVLVYNDAPMNDSWWKAEGFNSVEAAAIIQNLLIVYREMKDL